MNFTTRNMLTMLVALIINPDVSEQDLIALVKRRGFRLAVMMSLGCANGLQKSGVSMRQVTGK